MFVGGLIGLKVLPLVKGHERDQSAYAALMVCAGLGAFLFALFTNEFRWGPDEHPDADVVRPRVAGQHRTRDAVRRVARLVARLSPGGLLAHRPSTMDQ